MKVDFDNMRVQLVHQFNSVVSALKAHIVEDGELRMNDHKLHVLSDRLDTLRMTIVCLAFLSGTNETFGEVGDGLEFYRLDLENDDE